MTSSEQEGVIKYQLAFSHVEPHWTYTDIKHLNAWRTILDQLGLVGQHPQRYDGYGFGNISIRYAGGFLISGTQTGLIRQMSVSDYSYVSHCVVEDNKVIAEGVVQPSSESMTHGVIYQNTPHINCVLHVHSPEIWHCSHDLGLEQTDAEIPYGTVLMAESVAELIQSYPENKKPVFCMLGHEDGVVAYGRTLKEAGLALVDVLSKALSRVQS